MLLKNIKILMSFFLDLIPLCGVTKFDEISFSGLIIIMDKKTWHGTWGVILQIHRKKIQCLFPSTGRWRLKVNFEIVSMQLQGLAKKGALFRFVVLPVVANTYINLTFKSWFYSLLYISIHIILKNNNTVLLLPWYLS